ncbi:hypothetical protein HD597_011337 [Nonomuraea thailandensis]|uniref:Lipoprotein n=1 Tax=Nonomuraea thailandensis TaxID=1188745 RepID=A0A9X2GUX8_9ACTN|nr:hypothetical protein [Nonomuraea thailandensis]MCP2364317.1 hypothetical protein [Nonomuraea thailandensis]
MGTNRTAVARITALAALILGLAALTACKPIAQTPAYPDVTGTVDTARTWQTGPESRKTHHYELTVKHDGKTTKVTVTEAIYDACKAKLPDCLPVYDDF